MEKNAIKTDKMEQKTHNYGASGLAIEKFSERVLQVLRVTKVVKGGKQISFRATVAVGNFNGHVGLGVGKADEANKAVDRAIFRAKQNLLKIPLTKEKSISFPVSSIFGACRISMKPAPLKTGIVASGPMQAIFELTGIENISAKQQGAKNILNTAKATIAALAKLMCELEC